MCIDTHKYAHGGERDDQRVSAEADEWKCDACHWHESDVHADIHEFLKEEHGGDANSQIASEVVSCTECDYDRLCNENGEE